MSNRATSEQALLRAQQLFAQGLVFHKSGQSAQAQSSYDQVLKLQPGHFDALHLSGVLAAQARNYPRALELFTKAIKIDPGNAGVYNNRGNVLKELGQFDEALKNFDKAIALEANFAAAHNNRGTVLKELGQFGAALKSYDKAIELRAGHADTYYNRGNILQRLMQFDAALLSYDMAISLKEDHAEAYFNRGSVFAKLKQFDAALRDFDMAISIEPDREFFSGDRMHTRMRMCDWNDFETEFIELVNGIERNEKAVQPFNVLSIKDSPALQRIASESHVQKKFPANFSIGAVSKGAIKDKIRIGYFSADFRDHPVSFLTAELFEVHDRSRFEIIAFSFCPISNSEMHKRLRSAFDQFIDVYEKSDSDIARLSREFGIDIAVDLGGFTEDSRAGIFACRAAPIQLSYVGYLGTMGAEYMDYLVADPTIIPKESQHYYSEKIVYLPSYQVNDSKRQIADRMFTREELGLPNEGFVFCCFNNNYKITPRTFDGWMRILKAVEGSVLFLYADNPWAEENLKKEAQARGINDDRILFGKQLPRADYLARYRSADLFLDTFPYNAGTTASDALWAGLPVLTCAGESFASRVAASVLNSIHLPELITQTQEEYEQLAIELARNPSRLAKIRQKLGENRLTTPLFDAPLFARHLEAAYTTMYARYRADLPAEHIYIQT